MFGMPKSKYENNWVKSSVHGAHKVCLFHFLTMPQCDSEINSNLLVQGWTVAKLSVMTWGKPKFKVCHSSAFLGKKNKMVICNLVAGSVLDWEFLRFCPWHTLLFALSILSLELVFAPSVSSLETWCVTHVQRLRETRWVNFEMTLMQLFDSSWNVWS